MEQAVNSFRCGYQRYVGVGKQSIFGRMVSADPLDPLCDREADGTKASASASSPLESVPAEIKLNILRLITDFQTLRSLVLASPIYHSTYVFARGEFLTYATVFKLKDRNVDVLTPVHFAEVCVYGGKRLNRYLQPALQKLYTQTTAGLRIRLSATHCKALLTLVELKGFCPDHSLWGANRYNNGFRCVTADDDTHYLNLYGWRRYRVLAFGNQNAAARIGIKRQLNGAHHMAGVIRYQSGKRAAIEARNAKGKKMAKVAWALLRSEPDECIAM